MTTEYTSREAIADKVLHEDGSITTFSGREIASADETRRQEYAYRAPIADKWLTPDGAVVTAAELGISSGGGDGGGSTSAALHAHDTDESAHTDIRANLSGKVNVPTIYSGSFIGNSTAQYRTLLTAPIADTAGAMIPQGGTFRINLRNVTIATGVVNAMQTIVGDWLVDGISTPVVTFTVAGNTTSTFYCAYYVRTASAKAFGSGKSALLEIGSYTNLTNTQRIEYDLELSDSRGGAVWADIPSPYNTTDHNTVVSYTVSTNAGQQTTTFYGALSGAATSATTATSTTTASDLQKNVAIAGEALLSNELCALSNNGKWYKLSNMIVAFTMPLYIGRATAAVAINATAPIAYTGMTTTLAGTHGTPLIATYNIDDELYISGTIVRGAFTPNVTTFIRKNALNPLTLPGIYCRVGKATAVTNVTVATNFLVCEMMHDVIELSVDGNLVGINGYTIDA